MDEERQDGPIIHFSSLNMLGKAVYLGGMFTRAATRAVDSAIQATADIVTETRKAFHQGLDPNVEDARVIEETNEREAS